MWNQRKRSHRWIGGIRKEALERSKLKAVDIWQTFHLFVAPNGAQRPTFPAPPIQPLRPPLDQLLLRFKALKYRLAGATVACNKRQSPAQN